MMQNKEEQLMKTLAQKQNQVDDTFADSSVSAVKSGYLNDNFQLFHIKDQSNREFDFHYHDFNKIVVFLSGRVTYVIEGKSYFLKPWDILLVNNFDVHKPIIDPSVPYERIIIWVRNDLASYNHQDLSQLFACFRKASARSFSLIRLNTNLQQQVRSLLTALEDTLHSTEYASPLLASAQFIQLMVYLNRIFLEKQYIRDKKATRYDAKIQDLLQFINGNLTSDLSAETLSAYCFLSKYHLMRKFKEATGITLHAYITQKRLLTAEQFIRMGTPIVEASSQSGFQDYTTFSRAYKKMFGHAPSKSS